MEMSLALTDDVGAGSGDDDSDLPEIVMSDDGEGEEVDSSSDDCDWLGGVARATAPAAPACPAAAAAAAVVPAPPPAALAIVPRPPKPKPKFCSLQLPHPTKRGETQNNLIASLMRERAARARYDSMKIDMASKCESAIHILSTELSRGDIGLETKFKQTSQCS